MLKYTYKQTLYYGNKTNTHPNTRTYVLGLERQSQQGKDDPQGLCNIQSGGQVLMANCKQCNASITWGDHYVKGDKPKNMDGSTHYCKGNQSQNFAENYRAPKKEVTVEEILAELAIIQGFFFKEAVEFAQLSDAYVEGAFKYLISRKMSR